ncbi:hypothetical protein BC834DRAFT_842976 [Gloeopeniophorella convolvens]|nr:hypothetical protein BC834DRAFT_842976 [Gloeopeniophorella convolvens]
MARISTISADADARVPENAVRVLLTGYGLPGGVCANYYHKNPTWLAVAPLNNVVIPLELDPPSADEMQIILDADHPNGYPSYTPQHIHISALQLPLTYDAILEHVPGLHARPPTLPPANPPEMDVATPPEDGYDFIFHIGLAGRGPFRIERLGHKTGYRIKDSDNRHAPVVEFLPEANALEQAQTEMIEQMRASANMVIAGPASPIDATIEQPTRGFGKGYESYPEDLHTMIDVEQLVHSMKQEGMEQLYSSMDAGHYVCDYTYYCSLAESRRTSLRPEKGTLTKVLFMHCCPVDQPFSTEQVTDTIRKIIMWVSRNERW